MLDITAAEVESFKAAMASFASGVTVVTVHDPTGRPTGMTASAFSSVSVDPLLILVCLNRESRTYREVRAGRRFGINILNSSAEHISSHCARPGADKMLPEEWLSDEAAPGSPPALAEALAYLDCALVSEMPAGTHSVMLGRVGAIGLAGDGEPLVYFRGTYRDLRETEPAPA